MKTFTRPKIFRSTEGCCICKAKSSSSRFTDSERYEDDLEACFQLCGERRGEICNACVLVVKRWRKLPRRSRKNWSHVVDSKAGTGAGNNRSAAKRKRQQEPGTPGADEKLHKIRRKIGKRPKSSRQLVFVNTALGVSKVQSRKMSEPKKLNISSKDESLSDAFVSQYWKRRSGCCGEVLWGRGGERVLSAAQFSGCSLMRGGTTISSFVESELKMIQNSESKKKEDLDEGFCDKNSISTNPSSPESVKTIADDF